MQLEGKLFWESESIDNNKNIAHYFKNLSIDMDNDCTTGFESFHIKFEQFHISIDQSYNSKSKSVVDTLADNAFQYRITLSDETVFPITPASYIFNSFTDL